MITEACFCHSSDIPYSTAMEDRALPARSLNSLNGEVYVLVCGYVVEKQHWKRPNILNVVT